MKNKIFELLESKFPGARKDGLQQVASIFALTAGTEEEATALVGKMTAEAVEGYIKEWRKAADTENAKAAQTREDSLRAKFDFKDKMQPPTPPTPPTPTAGPTAEEIQRMISEAVSNATKGLTETVAAMTNSKVTETRRGLVDAALKEQKNLPDSYVKAVMMGFEGKAFKDDTEFNTYLEQTKTNASEYIQEMADKGLLSPKPTLGEPNKEGISQGVADFISEQGQPGNELGGKSI